MAKKRHHSSMMDERRHKEMKAAGMISEDKSHVANLPQNVKYTSWPKAYEGMDGYLDDTISGIDRQMDMDEKQARRHNVPKKW